MKTSFYKFAITCLLLLLSLGLKAQEGKLDQTFGVSGIKSISYGLNDYFKSIIVMPDGRLVVGGKGDLGGPSPNPKFYVQRLRSDGSPDGTFNLGSPYIYGITSLQMNTVEGTAIQNDGSIIFGGYTGNGSAQRAAFGKLNFSGTPAITPVAAALVPGSNANIITGISHNKITNTTTLSGYDFNTSAIMLGLKYLNNGNPDVFFNNGAVYLSGGTYPPLYATSVVNMDNGSTLLAGRSYDSTGNNQYTVVKLKRDGSIDTNFGNAVPKNGTAKIGIAGYYGYANTMTLLPSGKILLAGKMNTGGMGLLRLNADGTIDSSFPMLNYNYPGATGTEAYSIAIQPDNKIIVSGKMTQSTTSSGIAIRINTDGTIDNTWGVSGVLLISGTAGTATEIYSSDLNTKTGQIYFAGKRNGNAFLLARAYFYVQTFNILGKDIVPVSSENSYTIHPQSAAYTYTWLYSSSNIYSSGWTGDSIALYFKKDTPSGTLTCTITGGGLTKVVSKSIIVNPEPTFSEALTDISCNPSQTRCQYGYINSFMLSASDTALSSNSGCSASGYYDYTSSSIYDTLILGDNYQAELGYIAPTGSTVYAGVWIDFDNDGKMNNNREYVGASFSSSGSLSINNILIPADVEVGAKRMRVRLGAKEFTYFDYCPNNDEVGETEDYLILISKFDGIKTPNFITPNSDGKNDIFVIKGVEYNVGNSLKVYNKVGDLVYEASNYDNSWEGKNQNGESLKAGTYYYVFTQKSATKKKEDVIKGFLEIRY